MGCSAQLLFQRELLLVGHHEHLRHHRQLGHQHIQRRRGVARRLHDQAAAHVHEAGVERDAAERRQAADDEVTQLRQPRHRLPALRIVGDGSRFKLEFVQDLAELFALDEIESRLERGQQLLGDGRPAIGRPTSPRTSKSATLTRSRRFSSQS